MRLIDADALRGRMLAETPEHEKGVADLFLEAVAAMIDEQPTIEERKKGKWIAKEDRPKQEVFICSECGGWAYNPWIGSRKNPKPNRCKYTFCPNCGAKMER